MFLSYIKNLTLIVATSILLPVTIHQLNNTLFPWPDWQKANITKNMSTQEKEKAHTGTAELNKKIRAPIEFKSLIFTGIIGLIAVIIGGLLLTRNETLGSGFLGGGVISLTSTYIFYGIKLHNLMRSILLVCALLFLIFIILIITKRESTT